MTSSQEIFSQRSLVIAAHPDDEVIGMGGHLPVFNGVIIHVTDGAPENNTAGFKTGKEYSEARRGELLAAMDLAGIEAARCIAFGLMDQKAMFGLHDLTLRIAAFVDASRPSTIFTHPYEGGHPDHDSCAFAVNSAIKLLSKEGSEPLRVLEFTSYHAGPDGMEMDFLPNSISPIHVLPLSKEQATLKKRMAECFVTQQDMIRRFPIEVERFREAPDYDFFQPPHLGALLYEGFNWGVSGKQWRQLACDARRSLGMP